MSKVKKIYWAELCRRENRKEWDNKNFPNEIVELAIEKITMDRAIEKKLKRIIDNGRIQTLIEFICLGRYL